RPTRRYGKRNRPSRSVATPAARFVSRCRAVTFAPAITAVEGSVTRPLTLALLMVSCANAAPAAARKIAKAIPLCIFPPQIHFPKSLPNGRGSESATSNRAARVSKRCDYTAGEKGGGRCRRIKLNVTVERETSEPAA